MTTAFVALFCFAASWLGVAAQSFAMFLVLVWLFIFLRSVNSGVLIESYRSSTLSQTALIIGLAWLGLALLSSALNPWTSASFPEFIGGYLWWALGPFTVAALAGSLGALDAYSFRKFVTNFGKIVWVLLITGCLIAASQYFFGWKLQGIHPVPSEYRARILFSHPLSLAYILLLYVPLAAALLIHYPKSRLVLAVAGALLFLVFVSSSRTVQAVVVLVGGAFIMFGLRGRFRTISIGIFLCFGLLLATTSNPIRRRFISTMEQQEDRQQALYADDRIAFWAVHWDMFREKPLFGHGLSYHQDYLDRYYNAHGLTGLKKKYPAHNMFLQIMVNTGIAGLILWFARIAVDVASCVILIRGTEGAKKILSHLPESSRVGMQKWIGWVGFATIAGMMLAGLTQNAFQDSAVRFHWTILEGLLLWFTGRRSTAGERTKVTSP